MNVLAGMYDFYKSRSGNFWLFESSIWLHLFASSFVAVFIPVFLYNEGFSLSSIFLYYLILHTVNIPFNIIAGNLTGKIGSRNVVIIATIIFLFFFISFSFLQPGNWVIFLLMSFLAAVYDAFYYVSSLNIFMESNKDPENSGKNTGILNIVVSMAYLLGPLAGSAIILLSENENLVLYAATFFLFLSILPLFKIRDENIIHENKIMSLRDFFKSDREKKNHFSLMFYKIGEGIEYIIFPLYLFIIIGTLESVALLAVMIPVFSFFFTYLSGNIKRENRRFYIQLGSLLIALVWVSRIFFDGNHALYIGSILMSLLIIFVRVPIDSNIFRTGNEDMHSLSSSVYKNISGMFAKGLSFGILFLISILSEENIFIYAFLISALSALGVIFVNRYYWKKIESS